MRTREPKRGLHEHRRDDRHDVIALLLGALMFAAMMPGTSRGTEQADVQPCDKDCWIRAWFTFEGRNVEFQNYYCYPGGKWLCPLTNKEPQSRD